MHKMVENGVLERKLGSGTFTKLTSVSIRKVESEIANYSPTELIEIRIMLEPQIALMAAANASVRDIDLLKEISEIEKDEQSEIIENNDIDFNEHLAKISGNGLLQRLYLDVSTVRRKLTKTENIKKLESNKKPKIIANNLSFNDAERWLAHQDKVIKALENHLAKAAEEAVKQKLADLLFNQFYVVRRGE